jgi:hypothetical protein
MVRASKAQLELLEANLGSNQTSAMRASRHRDLPENLLESQIKDFLAWRGFISIRQHVGTFLPFRVVKQLQAGQITFEQALRNVVSIGEQGAADWWSARPMVAPGGRPLDGPHPWDAFWWEAKALGKKPTDAQLGWIDKRRQWGFEAAWFDQFSFRDRPAPVVEARDSNVFEVWFHGYFDRRYR